MILIDSSIWIDVLSSAESRSFTRFQEASLVHDPVVGDLVAVEVLQGFRDGAKLRLADATLSKFEMVTLCGPAIARKAADNFRALRRKGVTLRGTIDVIIATWCIENRVPLLHNDRDFMPLEKELGLIGWA